ncbi:MAG: lipid-A-disaccharide synthase [Verrucomicrobiota bacterium]|nr:lipid-A-disaccharide synthase [Limisphaera sp.]MDW8381592.1 lipid-A-disaccharide synthase [Verrucomicrobiota bacterium]
MRPITIMLIAGEPSGDQLGGQLASALEKAILEFEVLPSPDVQPLRTALPPAFFGAGGPAMRKAGVEVICDLNRWATVGLFDVLGRLHHYYAAFRLLYQTARTRQPDVIIGIDYGAFNLRLASALRRSISRRQDWFHPWRPLFVQYVSPQVWASRPGRARQMEQVLDLLLSILPFEPEWFAQRAPRLPVEFVGHPLLDRWPQAPLQAPRRLGAEAPRLVLLPGSRPDEIRRHGPLVAGAWRLLKRHWPDLQTRCVVPQQELVARLQALKDWPAEVAIETGSAVPALLWADLALTKSGTVTLECALAGLPAVVFYKTAVPTYWVGRHLVSVRYLAMPNLLAQQELYPELIQNQATPERLATAARELWEDTTRRERICKALEKVRAALGPPGASGRAAACILQRLRTKPSALPAGASADALLFRPSVAAR